MRGATITWMGNLLDFYISTHAPLAGRDAEKFSIAIAAEISTHAPLAGRDSNMGIGYELEDISTHAPLAGRDFMVGDVFSSMIFQPTRPLRGATPERTP